MKKIKRFIDNLHVKLLVWHQKVFDPLPDLLEEMDTYCLNCGSKLGGDCGDAEPDFNAQFCSKGCYENSNVIDARQRFLKNLHEKIKKQNEKYCEHCGLPIDECPGYKCWM
jgi:hypothetical protein